MSLADSFQHIDKVLHHGQRRVYGVEPTVLLLQPQRP